MKITDIRAGLYVFMSLTLSMGSMAIANAEGAVGLLIEPALTYETSSSKTNFPAPLSDSTGAAKGLGIGARVGFHFADVFFVGVDGRYSQPSFKDSSNNYDAKATSMNFGPVVGIQTPLIGLRVWGSYILAGTLDPDASNGFDVKYSKASGYRLGAGMRVVVVSLNLEYQEVNYGTTTVQEYGVLPASYDVGNVKLTNKSWIASVSFPIDL